MRKIVFFVFCLGWFPLFAQEMGAGLTILINSTANTVDNGTTKVEEKSSSSTFGGSFHYFRDTAREYEASLFFGLTNEVNAAGNTTDQTFLGLGGGINFHILRANPVQAGIGLKLRFQGYLEPVQDPPPAADYDAYSHVIFALEAPLFVDVGLNDHLLFRFSAVAGGFIADYFSSKVSGVTRTEYEIGFYTATTSDKDAINWFPVNLGFIYKF